MLTQAGLLAVGKPRSDAYYQKVHSEDKRKELLAFDISPPEWGKSLVTTNSQATTKVPAGA